MLHWQKNKEELETIITMLNLKFDVIGISETNKKKTLHQSMMYPSKDIIPTAPQLNLKEVAYHYILLTIINVNIEKIWTF